MARRPAGHSHGRRDGESGRRRAPKHLLLLDLSHVLNTATLQDRSIRRRRRRDILNGSLFRQFGWQQRERGNDGFGPS